MKIKYKFFGKNCYIDPELKDRTTLKKQLNEQNWHFNNIVFLNQIHSNKTIAITRKQEIYGDQNLPKADSLITNQKNLALAIVTADCAPILFFDEDKEIIAAAHAGWRGAKSGIIENTVGEMKNLGARNIKAVIGPLIHQRSYEVSKEFFDDFISENQENGKFFSPGAIKNKYQFNLVGYVEEKLKFAGIENIRNLDINTYSEEKHYHSYRRNTQQNNSKSGRNVSTIILTQTRR